MNKNSADDDRSVPVNDLDVPQSIEASYRDKIRGWMALVLLSTFSIEIIAMLLAVLWAGADIEKVKNIAIIILPPTTALLGSVAGFYYGSESK